MNRKQRREAPKQDKETLMNEKLSLFGMMGNKCTGCEAAYDKKNKEHVTTWTVMVYNESQTVKLFCPTCRSDIQAWAEDMVNV